MHVHVCMHIIIILWAVISFSSIVVVCVQELKTGLSENSVLNVFHPDAVDLFSVCSSLEKVGSSCSYTYMIVYNIINFSQDKNFTQPRYPCITEKNFIPLNVLSLC